MLFRSLNQTPTQNFELGFSTGLRALWQAEQPFEFTLASPTGASLLTDSTQVFSATVAGSSNQTVNWSVNGIAGGNSTVGTVSAAGLYVAPAAVPNPVTVTVRATAAANGTSYGEASVTISAAAPPPPQGLAIEVTEADGSVHVFHGVLSVRAVQQ